MFDLHGFSLDDVDGEEKAYSVSDVCDSIHA